MEDEKLVTVNSEHVLTAKSTPEVFCVVGWMVTALQRFVHSEGEGEEEEDMIGSY